MPSAGHPDDVSGAGTSPQALLISLRTSLALVGQAADTVGDTFDVWLKRAKELVAGEENPTQAKTIPPSKEAYGGNLDK